MRRDGLLYVSEMTRVENEDEAYLAVTFRMESAGDLDGRLSTEITVAVPLRFYDEADAIVVARAFLVDRLHRLLDLAEGWELTDEELARLKRPQSSATP